MSSHEHDDQISSEEEDWDADIADAPPPMTDSQADLYTMQSSGGMVTITPAGRKAQFTEVPAQDVEVVWPYPGGDNVCVYTSFDDFHRATPMEPFEDDWSQEQHFRATLKLPPGRYLLRFLVDGEYMIDDDQDVVCSLGNEYNALIVQDEAEAEESSSGGDDDDDDDSGSDWDVDLPEDAQMAKLKASASVLAALDTSKGMVTITPDMAANAAKLDQELSEEERGVIMRARGSSLQWDPHRRQFVLAAADDEDAGDEKKPESIAEEQEQTDNKAAMTDAEAEKLRKKREKNKRKKKRRKERKRLERMKQEQKFFGDTAPSGRDNASRTAKINKMKEEFKERENQWRQYWIQHEMHVQEERTKERAQWAKELKEERDNWRVERLVFAEEKNDLMKKLNAMEEKLDLATSDNSANNAALGRAKEAWEKEKAALLESTEKVKADLEAERAACSKARQETADVQAKLTAAEATMSAKASALAVEVKDFRSKNDQLQVEVDGLKGKLQRAEEELKVAKKEHASQLEEVKKDVALKAQELTQSAEAGKKEVQAAAEQRIEDLKKQLEERQVQIDQVRESLKNTQAELDASKSATTMKEKELAAVAAELMAAKTSITDKEAAATELQAKISALEAENKEAREKGQATAAELEAAAAQAKQEATETQAKLDATLGDLDVAKNQLSVKTSAFERERADLERRLEEVSSSRKKFAGVASAVAQAAQASRQSLEKFKEYSIREMGTMKSSFADTKRFLMQAIEAQSEMLAVTMKKYKKELSDRRKYFNLVQELRGNIRVYCRVRPMLESDKKWDNNKIAAEFPDENMVKIIGDTRSNSYEFDRVFSFDATQEHIFGETADLIKSCMDGYNVCIFAYGQTGSGKTFTMQGPPSNPGVNHRALTELFTIRDERSEDFEYKITVNYVEIYNEKVRDLLDKDGNKDKPMKIHRGPNGIYVDNLTEMEIQTEADVLKAMKIGAKNRSVGITNMNEHSSRSHSLLSVKVAGRNLRAGVTYYGKLHLIDLAGSERVLKSGAQGQRLEEAKAINKSLSALGDVIEALQKKRSHTPYRNSKLTYLLQDSLGGHAKTLMFINVSPTSNDTSETFSSLDFATRVRRVELGHAVRVIGKDSSSSGGAKKSKAKPSAKTAPVKRASGARRKKK